MIKITAIFGQEVITEYEKTGTLPSGNKEFSDGSQIRQKEFATIQERDAYIQALEESDGTDNWQVIRAEVPTSTKLQFKHTRQPVWEDFPKLPTVDDFNIDFPAAFMHGYYSSDRVAWEDDMQKFIDGEVTLEEFNAYGHDIKTKWQAEDEMKRLRQIIINETMEDFFTDFVAGKIEFRRITQTEDK